MRLTLILLLAMAGQAQQGYSVFNTYTCPVGSLRSSVILEKNARPQTVLDFCATPAPEQPSNPSICLGGCMTPDQEPAIQEKKFNYSFGLRNTAPPHAPQSDAYTRCESQGMTHEVISTGSYWYDDEVKCFKTNWTCRDKTWALMQSVDGSRHWCVRPPEGAK